MRFFEDQQLVWKLIEQLGLADQRVPFFANGEGPNDPDYPGLIWYLRGLRTAAQDGKTASTRYMLDDADQGQSSTKLLGDAIDRVIAANADVLKKHGIDKLETRKDWDTVKPELVYGGRKLWKLGFWNLLFDLVSAETYQYIVDSFGYYTLTLNWNAAEAIQSVSLDFTGNSLYMTLSKGYDQLPKALYDAVREHVFTTHPAHQLRPRHRSDHAAPRRRLRIKAQHRRAPDPCRATAGTGPAGALRQVEPADELDVARAAGHRPGVPSVQTIPRLREALVGRQRLQQSTHLPRPLR